MAADVEGLVHDVDVNEALGAGVEAAEGGSDRRAALVAGLLPQRAHQLVVGNLVRLVRAPEAVEELLELCILQGARLLVKDFGHGHQEGVQVERPGVGRVGLAEHVGDGRNPPGALAVEELAHPRQGVLGRHPDLLSRLGLGILRTRLAASASDEVGDELLVVDEAIHAVAVVDGAQILLTHSRGEGHQGALELVKVGPPRAGEVVVAEGLH
mmetsp:Transcript_84499/g.217644  ORF Transcript_84499/g.217644 Transcript_84499/m.217644 type:complete len:212 (+) Transcript_84499:2026-2661(+)